MSYALSYNELSRFAKASIGDTTNREIAEQLGVSIGAVSHALTGRPGMIKLLRKIVENYSEYEVADGEYFLVKHQSVEKLTGNSDETIQKTSSVEDAS